MDDDNPIANAFVEGFAQLKTQIVDQTRQHSPDITPAFTAAVGGLVEMTGRAIADLEDQVAQLRREVHGDSQV